MAEAEEAGDHELPDFSALVPGGVPVFDDEEPGGVQATEAATAVPEIADDGGMALPSTTTAAPATTGDDVAVPATTTAVPATATTGEVASSSAIPEFSPPPRSCASPAPSPARRDRPSSTAAPKRRPTTAYAPCSGASTSPTSR